jgi:hypothetical protein
MMSEDLSVVELAENLMEAIKEGVAAQNYQELLDDPCQHCGPNAPCHTCEWGMEAPRHKK